MIKISIVIPVYNVEHYIEDCLHSVEIQSYENIEVILVDDCGTDESMFVAERYMKQHAFRNAKIVKHTHNRGLSAARNTGLKTATGEYVFFLDSDDELTNDCIAIMVEPLKKIRYDFVIANYEVTGSDKKYPPLTLPEGEILNDNILNSYAEGKWYMMAWNKLCRRDFLMDNDLYFEEGLLHEDVVWSFKLACKALSMYVVTTPTYLYRIRTSSIMTDATIEKDAVQYISVFEVITHFVVKEKRQMRPNEYHILEGRKSTLLFSLLEKNENALYDKCYIKLYRMGSISPWKAYRNKIIGIKYLLRDLHYIMPMKLGKVYKRLFYNLCYKWRGRRIEGALW